jgi:hypothetical protein
MSMMVKVFVLREAQYVSRMLGWLNEHWRQMASAGKPLVIQVHPFDAPISPAQRGFYHGSVLKEISEATGIAAETWHDYYKAKFIGVHDRTGKALSSETLSMAEYAIYTEQVMADAVQEKGIEFSFDRPHP